MRTIVIFTLCFILGSYPVFAQSAPVVYTQINNGFTVSFTLPSYTLKDTTLTGLFNTSEIFKYIKLDNFGIIDDIGYPQLPQYSFDLHIPAGASNFVVASSNQVTQVVSLNRRVLPAQEDFDGDSSLPLPFDLNQLYYASNGSLYNFTNKLSDPYIVFGEQGITMSVFPFLYNPQANTITVVKSVTFTVTYTPLRGGQAEPDSSSKVKEDFLSSFFANYTPTRGGGTSFGGKYLIITHSNYVSTLATFVSYKQALGYIVTLVNSNSIPNGTTSTGIKTYLRNLYTANRPDFVLLVGNHSQIPASAGSPSGGNKNDPITDLLYTCMFDEFLFPVTLLGRFPVSSTAELQRIIEKTMYMESNIHNFAKKAKFVAGKGYDNLYKAPHDYVIKNTFNGLGYVSQKLYQPNAIDVRNAINDNPLYFIYRGHGNFTDMYVNSSFSINQSFLTNSATTNTIYPFVFSFTCKSGNFAHPTYTCNGTSWLTAQNSINNRGGVSFFGASVITNTHTNNVIEENVFGDAFTSQERLGSITTLGMINYGNRYWSLLNPIRTKRHMKAYNLLGDPSLNVKGNGWSILGPSVVNTTGVGFSLSGNLQDATWSVTSGFSIVSQNGTSAVVKATQANNQTGVLTAIVKGARVIKNIQACNPSILGPSSICSGDAVFTVVDLPSSITSIVWSFSSNLKIKTSGGGGGGGGLGGIVGPIEEDPLDPPVLATSITLNNNLFPSIMSSSYPLPSLPNLTNNGWVTAKVYNGNVLINNLTHNITVGSLPPMISGPYLPGGNYLVIPYTSGYYRFIAQDIPNNVSSNNIRWVSAPVNGGSSGTTTIYEGRDVLIYLNWNDNYVRLQWLNSPCGHSIPSQKIVAGGYRGGGGSNGNYHVNIYPNPVSDILTIEIEYDSQNGTNNRQESDINFDIRLYDGQGNLLRKATTKGGTVEFNVSNLPLGFYYLHIYDGVSETPEMRQIMVEH